MNKILKLYRQFITELENSNIKKSQLNLANKFYKEIEEHQGEIKHPVDLEELLRSTKTRKENKRELILIFYDFLKNDIGMRFDTDLGSKIIIDDEMERKIALIQYMQMNKVNLQEIADLFMMSSKSMKKMLDELEDGVEILGTTVKIKMDRDKRNIYSVVSHQPIFLNLSIPEVISLTVGLAEAADSSELYAPLFRKIAKDVYDNLTTYAKGCVSRMAKNHNAETLFNEEIRSYEEHISSSLINMMKEECKGTIHVHSGNKDYVFTSCRITGFGDNKITLETRDGKLKQFNISEVYACESNFHRDLQ